MPRFGLVGGSYTSQSLNADAQATINFYPEAIESQAGNAPIVLYPTPGTKTFVNLARTVTPAVDGIVGVDVPQVTATGTGNPVALATQTPTGTYDSDFAIFNIASLVGGGANAFTPNGGWSTFNPGFGESVTAAIAAGGNMANSVGRYSASCTLLGMVGSSAPSPKQTVLTGTQSLNIARTFASPTTAGSTILVMWNGPYIAALGTPTATVVDDASGGSNVYQQIGYIYDPAVTMNATVCYVFAAFNAKSCQNVQINAVTNTSQGPGSYSIGEYVGGVKAVTNSGPTRGELTITGRTFVVCGTDFDEIMSNGTFTTWGQVANDSLPVTMAATPQQLLLASAGTAYVFDLTANTLTPIAGATFSGPVSQAAVCDDFFILTIKASKTFYVSAPLDATDWVTNGSAIVSVFPDNIVSMIVDHRQVWFFSDTKSVVYYDSGNIFPFDVIPGSFMEAGNAAEFSTQLFPNGVVWLGSDERGAGVVWLGPPGGGTPTRISNHALEFAIQGYTRIDDAVAITYQDQGHLFYQIYFPTPSVTWTYDVNTQMWHQRGYFVESIGDFRAVHYWNHTYNFGKHLVGDWQSGRVYQLHIPTFTAGVWSFADDDGNPIVRVRRAPHISEEQKRQFHAELQVYLETGIGPAVSPGGQTIGPTEIVLQSPDLTFWTITIQDSGTITKTSGALGPSVSGITLNYPAQPGTSWQITINDSGTLQATEVGFGSYPITFPMTTLGGLQSGLKVTGF